MGTNPYTKKEGVSLNMIVKRRRTKIFLLDSCPCDSGGFSVKSGRAWMFKLPSELIGKVSKILLEFLAEVICMWLDTHEGRMDNLHCSMHLETTQVQ